jgi:hypothetical protein
VEEGRIKVEEREGRVRDFRELDMSANKHEFSLRWVKGEKVRRHPVGNVREDEDERPDAVTMKERLHSATVELRLRSGSLEMSF